MKSLFFPGSPHKFTKNEKQKDYQEGMRASGNLTEI